MKTTKSVWPLSYDGESDYKGSHTLENREYAEYIKVLKDRGFEIGFHGPSMVSNIREKIQRSFNVYYDVLASYPRIYASHAGNRENLYWGEERLTYPFFRKIYTLLANEEAGRYQGHIEGSDYFWGDLSLQHIDYVRNFTFKEVNLFNISNVLPYANKRQPWVNSWFFSSDADNVEEFNRLLNKENQDKLVRQRGVCIVSTHFGKGFIKGGKIHDETEELLLQMSIRNGWFVPVSTALDFLAAQRTTKYISHIEVFKLELRWFAHILARRRAAIPYAKTEIPYLNSSISTPEKDTNDLGITQR
jgi:hypothetical protein